METTGRGESTTAFTRAKSVFGRQGKVLLILDNVASDGVLSLRSNCLPSLEHVHVLATTRLDPQLWGIPPLRLDSLSTADALDLFLKHRPFETPEDQQLWGRLRSDQETIVEDTLEQKDADQEWKAAVGIVNRLGGHALAIEVVAVFLGHNHSIGLSDYLRGLAVKGVSLKLDQAGGAPAVRARLSSAIETNIGLLLAPTLERLERETPLAMRALEWAALMPPDHVPWNWLRSLLEQDEPDALAHDPDDPDPWQGGVMRRLVGWRLLESEGRQKTARIHRIVQTVMVQGLANGVEEKRGRLLNLLEKRARFVNRKWGQKGVNWELTPLYDSAQLLLESIGVRVWILVDWLIKPLRLNGRLLPAVKIQERAIELEETRAKSAPENADYARDLWVSYSRQARVEEDDGNAAGAKDWWRRAHDTLQAMCDRGWFVSEEDRKILKTIKSRLES